MRRRALVGLLLILLVAGALRGYRLKAQPIFIDEDLYTVAVLRLDSLSPRSIGRMAAQVVKPPLPLLSQALLGRITGDALTAGRLLSASGGVATTLLTYFLGRRLGRGHANAGLLAAAAYALCPVAVLHERMVLQDGLLTPAALGAVLVGWSAIERGDPRLGALAAGFGFIAVQMKLSGVALAAAPALILLATLPFTAKRELAVTGSKPHFLSGLPGLPELQPPLPLGEGGGEGGARAFRTRVPVPKGEPGRRPYRPVLAAAFAAAGPLVSYLLLRLSPLGPFLGVQDEARFALLGAVDTNLQALGDAARTYFPAGIWALVLLGVVWLGRTDRAGLVVVLGMLGIWILPWLFVSNFAPSRYYLPAVPYLAALAGAGGVWLIEALARRLRPAAVLASVAVLSALGMLAVLGAGVAVDRASASLSQLDDWQYRSGWPAGGAYASAADLVAGTSGVDGRVYMIDARHLLASGAFGTGPGQAWVIDPGGAFPPDARGNLLVMIDNVDPDASGQLLEQTPGRYVSQLRQAAADAQLLEFFAEVDSAYGVAVLRVRPRTL